MTRDQYRQAIASNGKTQRDRAVNKGIHDMNKLGPLSPSYKDVLIDSVPRKVNIISSTVTTQKIFHTRPGEDFTIGSIMEWSNSHWLITERDAEDEITVRGKIQICQKEIVWQDVLTHDIVARWATVEKPYYSNLKENNYIGYSTREFRVQMPFDEYSERLDIDKRLMLEIINNEPKTYRITSIDQMTGRIDYNNDQIGFLSFNIEQDLYNPETDNVNLMICDYIEPETSDQTGLVISHSGSNELSAGGLGKKLNAVFNGEESDSIEWTISTDTDIDGISFENGLSKTIGSSCRICCNDDHRLIGTTIYVTARYNDYTKTISLEVI